MSGLESFPITGKWPPEKLQAIQLYSFPTPNGIKVSAMLEETGLDYEAHLVRLGEKDQYSREFFSLNPNNKIPAIIDPDGPGGKPLPLWESGAILLYLAEKSGKLLPQDTHERYQALQWLMWQMGGVGPMFGQVGYFYKFAGKEIGDKRPLERYRDESARLLKVLDHQLADRDYVLGAEYSVADIAIWPWVRSMVEFYQARDLVKFDDLAHVPDWFSRCLERPSSRKALNIPAREG